VKKIEMIDIKVESKINITFGTIGGETFKFLWTYWLTEAANGNRG